MLTGMGIATVFLYIRSIYRTIELLDGWTGPIITNQSFFNLLDGMPITVAMYALNVFHPGPLLKPPGKTEMLSESLKEDGHNNHTTVAMRV
ncbi:hypothetical protein FRC02_009481 [Tulasnella sp. 418]|nr:hypothetical protein FRC02_009481 [Tulasnella sp. 418]